MDFTAFVIMPFDDEFDGVYSDLIVAPLSEAGYVVSRADDVDTQQNILADVVHGIAGADLVIADLTASNPNVFYELGLAHAMGVPTVLIAHRDSAEDIPFDLRQYRTEFYDTHFQRAGAIKNALHTLGVEHCAGKVRFSSPISDFLPEAKRPAIRAERAGVDESGALGLTTSVESDATNDGMNDGSEEDDRGILDFVDEIGEGAEEFIALTSEIGSAIETMSTQVTELATQMNTIDSDTPSGQVQRRRLLIRSASALDAFAENVESRLSDYETAVDRVTSNGLGYFTLLTGNPDQFQSDINTALQISVSLRDAVAGSNEGMAGFRDSVASLPPIIKQVNRARKRTVRALDAVLAQHERVRSYAEQSIHMTETALGDSTRRPVDGNAQDDGGRDGD
jgi:hypothetical protein